MGYRFQIINLKHEDKIILFDKKVKYLIKNSKYLIKMAEQPGGV